MTRFEIIFPVILLFLSSCKTQIENGIGTPEFPFVGEAKISILGNDLILPLITDLSVIDTAIIATGSLDDYWVHTYDKNSGNPIADYISKGQGPSDILGCTYLSKAKDGWKIYDYMSRKVKLYDKDFAFIGMSDKDSLLSSPMDCNFTALQILPSGKKICYIDKFENGDLIFDGFFMADSIGYSKPFLNLHDEDEIGPLGYYMQYKFAGSPDGKKLAAVSSPGCCLKLFDTDGNNLILKSSHCYYPLTIKNPEDAAQVYEDNKRSFTSLAVTDSRIIACMDEDPDNYGPTDILVWDWEGNPICRYKSDKIIVKFALSPDNLDEIFAFVTDPERNYALAKIYCQGLLK